MSIKQTRARAIQDRQDTFTLVWSATVLAAFFTLLIDPRVSAIICAFGVYWVLGVMRRRPLPTE